MDKKVIIAIVATIAVVATAACVGYNNVQSAPSSNVNPGTEPAQTVQITDQEGRVVTIPANVTRVAAVSGQAYEKMILLNQTDKMKMTISAWTHVPWSSQIAPQLKEIPIADSPNIEDLMSKKVQVVFCLSYDGTKEKVKSTNIAAVVTQKDSGNPDNIDSFAKYVKQEIKLYGEVMGPDAEQTADKWGAYFDQKENFVLSRTANLTDSQRPKVYYARGPAATTFQGKNSYPQFYTEIAGGKFISGDSELQSTITSEQLLAWDPDVIFVGRVNSTDIFTKDPKYSNLKAVKNNRVYLCPLGVVYWDYGAEGMLLMEFFAKTLHPELFPDLNMTNEVKEYYSTFYHYNLTDDEANRILKHLPPANSN